MHFRGQYEYEYTFARSETAFVTQEFMKTCLYEQMKYNVER